MEHKTEDGTYAQRTDDHHLWICSASAVTEFQHDGIVSYLSIGELVVFKTTKMTCSFRHTLAAGKSDSKEGSTSKPYHYPHFGASG